MDVHIYCLEVKIVLKCQFSHKVFRVNIITMKIQKDYVCVCYKKKKQ